MNLFNVQTNESSSSIEMALSGSLNENSDIPLLKNKKKPVNFDLIDLKYVNSYGVKLWCKWVSYHSTTPYMVFKNAPFVFVKHIALIKGFWTAQMAMASFFVPYYNEESQERKDILFVENINYDQNGELKTPTVIDSKGQEMEIDVNLETYFSFLKKK